MRRERRIVGQMLDHLNSLPRTKAIKTHGSVFSEKGTPDIIGSMNSRAFVIEAKDDDGKLSPIQVIRLRQWAVAGARCGAARDVATAEDIAKGALIQTAAQWQLWT